MSETLPPRYTNPFAPLSPAQLLKLDPQALATVEACDNAKEAVLHRKYALQARSLREGSDQWRTVKALALVFERICNRRSELRRSGLAASDRAIAVAAEKLLSPAQWNAVLAEARSFEAARKQRALDRAKLTPRERAQAKRKELQRD